MSMSTAEQKRRRDDNDVDRLTDGTPFLTARDEDGWLGWILDLTVPVFLAGVVTLAVQRVAWALVDIYALYLWHTHRRDYDQQTCSTNIALWLGLSAVAGYLATAWLAWLYAARTCACTGRCCGSEELNAKCRTDVGVAVVIALLVYIVFSLGWLIYGAQTIFTLKDAEIDGDPTGKITRSKCGRGIYTFAFWYQIASWISTPLVWTIIALMRRCSPALRAQSVRDSAADP